MSNYAISLKRTSLLLAALAFTALLLVVNFASFFSTADAAQLTARSLNLSSTLVGTETTGLQGSETNGSDAIYTITFTKTANAVQSIQLEFCDDPLDTCVAPTDIDVSTATIGGTLTSAGAAGTNNANHRGWSFASNTATSTTITLTGVENPSVTGTFFVRITTHSGAVPSGGNQVDYGNVASSITTGIEITARVKETLGFSTTGEMDTTHIPAPGSACDPLTGDGAITIGDPTENALALDTMYHNYSAFRTYTNALTGMAVKYEAETLTSGSNNINAAGGTDVAFAVGTEQFGLGVDDAAGTEVAHPINSLSGGTGNFLNANVAADFSGDAGELTIDPDYDEGNQTANKFAFVASSQQDIATSSGYVNCVTVPVRYAANISPLTAPGVYTTTVVYTAVPQY